MQHKYDAIMYLILSLAFGAVSVYFGWTSNNVMEVKFAAGGFLVFYVCGAMALHSRAEYKKAKARNFTQAPIAHYF